MFMRIYSGADGESHFEDLSEGLLGGQLGRTETQSAEEIFFTRLPAGNDGGWHTAPRRQYVIGIAGAVEIVTGDGTAFTFGPGDVLLAEDLTGHGHTTRVVSEGIRVSAMVPLRE
jgi:quercetin dioxygenase-like cupin family protein